MKNRPRSRYTLRGVIGGTYGNTAQLVVDDGLFTNGFRIVFMETWHINQSTGETTILHLGEQVPVQADASQGSQFVWSFYTPASVDRSLTMKTVIDPDHIVNQDMFITVLGGALVCYVIHLEPYSMSEDEAILQLIKNNNQV